MSVTDDQVATLRALLVRDIPEHQRMREQLDRDGSRGGYMALLEAAFFEAVDQRFTKSGAPDTDVVDFVADVRSRSTEAAEEVDPRAAERLVRAVLGIDSMEGLDDKNRFGTELVLLIALVDDEQLDGNQLDQFLGEARKLGDELLR